MQTLLHTKSLTNPLKSENPRSNQRLKQVWVQNVDECLTHRLGLTLVALDHGLFEINVLAEWTQKVILTSVNFQLMHVGSMKSQEVWVGYRS